MFGCCRYVTVHACDDVRHDCRSSHWQLRTETSHPLRSGGIPDPRPGLPRQLSLVLPAKSRNSDIEWDGWGDVRWLTLCWPAGGVPVVRVPAGFDRWRAGLLPRLLLPDGGPHQHQPGDKDQEALNTGQLHTYWVPHRPSSRDVLEEQVRLRAGILCWLSRYPPLYSLCCLCAEGGAGTFS